MLIIPCALGAGFTFDGLGVKARGMGGAFRAVADDWSAAYYNPAGYSRIADNYIGGTMTFLHNRYTLVPTVSVGGYTDNGFYNYQEVFNEHEILHVPQGSFVFRLPVWEEMVFGVSLLQIYDQNQNWQLYSNLPAYNFALFPQHQFYNNLDVMAFQVTAARSFMEERLSVGIGLALLRGDLTYSSLVLHENPFPEPLNDRPYDRIPNLYSNDGHGWGVGFRAGFLYDLNDKIDLGLVLNSGSSITISGKTEALFYMANVPNNEYFPTSPEYYVLSGEVHTVKSDFETELDLPFSIGAGIAYQFNDKLLLTLDGEYTFWSTFKGFEFKNSDYVGLFEDASFGALNDLFLTSISVPVDWKDGGRVMIGADYKLSDFADLRGGFGIDQTIVSADTFIPQFIDLTTKYTYSLGVGFDVEYWRLELATTYTHQADLAVPWTFDYDDDGLPDNISGDYEGDNYQTILGISYRF
jgi:long-chain fatty acid transport protein